MPKAASPTTAAMIDTATGALRVRGRSSVPSSTSSPASSLSAATLPGVPCMSSTSPERSSRSATSPASEASSAGRYIASVTTPNRSGNLSSRRDRRCSGDSSVTTTSTSCWSSASCGWCSGGRPATRSASYSVAASERSNSLRYAEVSLTRIRSPSSSRNSSVASITSAPRCTRCTTMRLPVHRRTFAIVLPRARLRGPT